MDSSLLELKASGVSFLSWIKYVGLSFCTHFCLAFQVISRNVIMVIYLDTLYGYLSMLLNLKVSNFLCASCRGCYFFNRVNENNNDIYLNPHKVLRYHNCN